MSDDPEDLGETDLHLAGTRPAMVPVLQVPVTSFIVLLGITAELVEIYWRLAVLSIPLWPVALWVFRRDHNGMRVLSSWLKTAGLDLRASWFGATTIEVFPIGRSKKDFRGIP
jgi:type IV secretory pathway VirB3-like protein